MRLPGFLTRRRHTVEDDHFAIEDVARNLYATYTNTVADGCTSQGLAQVITGLAGCALTQSCTGAMAWEYEETDGDGWSFPDTERLAGYLLLEVARCVDDDPWYRSMGLVSELDAVKDELFAVAQAYAGDDSALIGQRLFELGHAVSDRTGSAAGEALMPLARAHGYEWCCPGCGESAAEDVAS